MRLDATDEQRMLGDTVRRLLASRYDARARLSLLESDLGWSRGLWQQYASLGLLGLTIDEEYGGAGLQASELLVVMEEFGRALILEPFVATVVLGAALLSAAGSPEQKEALLPRVANGELLLALAATEPGSRWSLTEISAAARRSGDAWVIDGEKIAVLGGDVADHLLVTARTPDGTLGLFLVDSSDVSRTCYRLQDGLGGANLSLAGAPALAVGIPDAALPAIETVLDLATAALCAEAVGAMDRMLWLTVDYLKTREQFGHPLAQFQALAFRVADMYVAVEQSRSMAMLARAALPDNDVLARRRTIRAAKLLCDISSRHVGQEAVQLHGGIGMTMENSLGHYVKRTAVIAKTFADSDILTELVGAEGGLIREA
jgi:alkylation response protein AidB-like acyl-CoA dehydrogenase